MRPTIDESDLPDFLHDSPFLPIGTEAYSYPKHVPKPRPTLRQLLLSKATRGGIFAFFALLLFLIVRSKFKANHVLDRLTGPSCYFTRPVDTELAIGTMNFREGEIDWSQFAYALYATDKDYLCNAVMIFESLQKLGSKAERLLMFSNKWSLDDGDGSSVEDKLLLKARDEYGVKLQPVEILHENTAYYYGPNWADSYTKLLAFNQTQFSRLIVLDSDSTILSSLDHLFFLPPSPIVLPRAYWLYPKTILSSHIMVITPTPETFKQVMKGVKKAKYGVYDMEIINALFGSTCSLLPHRQYALLTGEYRSKDHEDFLNLEVTHNLEFGKGEEREGRWKVEWDPDVVTDQAAFIHFSDHPLGKPWLVGEEEVRGKYAPTCNKVNGWADECRTRDVWLDFYEDFWGRRQRVCG